jgi:hypothetical protein
MLAGFITASAVLSMLFFATVQFQARLAELQLNGVPVTVWRLESLRPPYRRAEERIRQHESGIHGAQIQLAAVAHWHAQKRAEIAPEEALIRSKLQDAVALGVERDREFSGLMWMERPREAATLLRANPAAMAIPKMRDMLDEVDESLKRVAVWRAEADKLEAEMTGLRRRVEIERESAPEARAALAAALGLGANAADLAAVRERVDALLGESDTMKGPDASRPARTVNELSRLPRELLVLALVLSMGVLGSGLFMATRFEEDYALLSWPAQILRPCAGAVTALVLYIVVKAGLLVVADPTQVGGHAPVNPFFISFLGILAGLMSERVLHAVKNVGETFLHRGEGAPEDRARWTTGDLSPMIVAARRTPEQLAACLAPMSPDDVREIIQARRPAKAREQQVIAAFLGRDPREIFTDLGAAARSP